MLLKIAPFWRVSTFLRLWKTSKKELFIYRNTRWATVMLALNVGASVALPDILTSKDTLHFPTTWGDATMSSVVATIILHLIISRTIPMPTAMMIGDIKHQSKSAGKRNLFQLSLIASWWSKHCMAILSILCTDTFQRSLAKRRQNGCLPCTRSELQRNGAVQLSFGR